MTNSPSGSLLLNAGSSLRITSTIPTICHEGFSPSFGPASTSPHFCLHFRKFLRCFQKKQKHIPSQALQPATASRTSRTSRITNRAPRGRVVIFSNLPLTADSLAHQLKREGMTCRHLHGKLDQDRGRMCVVGLVVSSVF